MGDARGGWKALDTAFVRDHLHAATAVGGLARPRPRPSSWATGSSPDRGRRAASAAGPSPASPTRSARSTPTASAQITAAVGADASYAARSVAARATRDRKAEQPLQDLMSGWQAELTSLPATRRPPSTAAVDAAGAAYWPRRRRPRQSRRRAARPGGRLASEKTFTRGDVIVAVAPHLHGLPARVPRPGRRRGPRPHRGHPPAGRVGEQRGGVGGTLRARRRGPHRRAGRRPRGPGRRRGALEDEACDARSTALQDRLGGRLTDSPTGAWRIGLMTERARSGRGGRDRGIRQDHHPLRGAGRLRDRRLQRDWDCHLRAGGQDSRRRGREWRSRTIASLDLAPRARHPRRSPTGMWSSVDETRDDRRRRPVPAVGGGASGPGPKMIVVGDDRQLDAVGPGGALTALSSATPSTSGRLSDNLRQRGPGRARRPGRAPRRQRRPPRSPGTPAGRPHPSRARPAPRRGRHGARRGRGMSTPGARR